MKILYLIPGFYRPAGMERVIADKANWLARHGHSITIVTTDQRGQAPAFSLEPGVHITDLAVNYEATNGRSFLTKALAYPLKSIRHRKRLRRLMKAERPDIVIDTFGPEASWVPRVAGRAHTVLEIHFSRHKLLQYARKGIWKIADKLRSTRYEATARRYNRFVTLTAQDAAQWKDVPGLRIIPNASPFTFPEAAKLENKQVLAVGRYSHQKGFDRLVEAWKSLDTTGWTLRIAGAGDINELGGALPSNVITGPSADMPAEYLASSILAASSRYEGLPMALIEAQTAGLPIVAFDCECGPRDIITDGTDGLLVPEGDIPALAESLKKLMADSTLRTKMGAAAREAAKRYDPETIMQQWMNLFTELS